MTSKEFISKKVASFLSKGLNDFPANFIIPCSTIPLNIPSEILILGNEFFGSYEVLTTNGSLFGHAESFMKAKYIVYAGSQKNKKTVIPEKEKDIELIVKSYEKYLDVLLRQIEKEYNSEFPEGKELHSVSNEIFKKLNLIRL